MGRIGYVPYGPIVVPGSRAADVSELLAYVVRQQLGAKHFRALFVQPSEGDDRLRSNALSVGFRPSRVAIAPTGSLRVDVQADEAELQTPCPSAASIRTKALGQAWCFRPRG